MLTKRRFEFTLTISGKPAVFKYEQATAMETLLFLEDSKEEGFNPYEWCATFLAAHTTEGITAAELLETGQEMHKVWVKVMESRFKSSFGDEKDVPDWTPNGAYWAFLAKELHSDPLSIAERYTFEQLKELTEGIIWNWNEQTEEGKKKNSVARSKNMVIGIGKENVNAQVNNVIEIRKKLDERARLARENPNI